MKIYPNILVDEKKNELNHFQSSIRFLKPMPEEAGTYLTEDLCQIRSTRGVHP